MMILSRSLSLSSRSQSFILSLSSRSRLSPSKYVCTSPVSVFSPCGFRFRSFSSPTTASALYFSSSEEIEDGLFGALSSYRDAKAKEKKRYKYTVFTNKALKGICDAVPQTLEELNSVKGIGPKIMEAYGDDILEIVEEYGDIGDRVVEPFDLIQASSRKTIRGAGSGSATISGVFKAVKFDQLSTLQQETATRANTGENLFITGGAGTGKSTLLRHIISALQKKHGYDSVGITAPTGVAAVNVNGQTLHSFFGIGLGNGSRSALIKKVLKNQQAVDRIVKCKTLVIDEISMLDRDLFETIDAIATRVREVNSDNDDPDSILYDADIGDLPFGGIQIIAVGDFFQLPPVRMNQDQKEFSFSSPVWESCKLRANQVNLEEQFRQQEGSSFVSFLNNVRVGSVQREELDELNSKCLISSDHPLPDDGIIPTKLYCVNKDVDKENETNLRELPGEVHALVSRDYWKTALPSGNSAVKRATLEKVDKEIAASIDLKVGSQVMLLRNNARAGLVNGSRGVVERFVRSSEGGDLLPVVKFDNGLVTSVPYVETLKTVVIAGGETGVFSRSQVPLKLAWAITVHKSQGSTLTRAVLDIGRAFDWGQVYVALSRVTGMDGLWLKTPIQKSIIKVNPLVAEYYGTEAALSRPYGADARHPSQQSRSTSSAAAKGRVVMEGAAANNGPTAANHDAYYDEVNYALANDNSFDDDYYNDSANYDYLGF